jgi:hypothetical protein
VACKIHQIVPQWDEAKKANYIKHATREYEIQRNLNHPRLVRLLDGASVAPAPTPYFCKSKGAH